MGVPEKKLAPITLELEVELPGAGEAEARHPARAASAVAQLLRCAGQSCYQGDKPLREKSDSANFTYNDS